jgi:hypothetical protein
MLEFTKWVDSDFLKDFSVPQAVQKHGWQGSLVW